MSDDGGFTSAGEVAEQVMQGKLFDAPERTRTFVGFSINYVLAKRPELRDVLTKAEIALAQMVEGHIGQAQAIRIKTLAVLMGEGWEERSIKDSISRLRVIAHMPIAATKVPPYGLFMPATAEEAHETHDRLFGEGVRLIILSQLFARDRDLARKLEGQLDLELKGSSADGQPGK